MKFARRREVSCGDAPPRLQSKSTPTQSHAIFKQAPRFFPGELDVVSLGYADDVEDRAVHLLQWAERMGLLFIA